MRGRERHSRDDIEEDPRGREESEREASERERRAGARARVGSSECARSIARWRTDDTSTPLREGDGSAQTNRATSRQKVTHGGGSIG